MLYIQNFIIVFLLSLGTLFTLKAQTPIAINDDFIQLNLSNQVSVVQDEAYTIEAVSSLPTSIFTPNTSNYIYKPYFCSNYWVKFNLSNQTAKEQNLFVSLEIPSVSLVEFYFFKNGEWKKSQSGTDIPFNEREIYHREHVFNLHLDAKKATSIYLKIDNNGNAWSGPLKLFNTNSFSKNTYQSQFTHALFYGSILLVLITNFYLSFRLKKKAFIFYILYILLVSLIQLNIDGYAQELFYPQGVNWFHNISTIIIGLYLFCKIRFFQIFLESYIHLPRLDIVLTILSIVSFLWACLGFFDPINYYLLALDLPFIVLVSVFILATNFFLFKRVKRKAKYHFLGHGSLVGGMVLLGTAVGGSFFTVFIKEYALKIGTIIEIIVLTILFIDDVRFRQQELKKLDIIRLEKINKMVANAKSNLEKMVVARTKQLRLEKEKVEIKNEEINSLNQYLEKTQKELEIKNNDIIDSINYAYHIQRSILPVKLAQQLFKECFILYLPKDIVSGDFYWFSKHVIENKIVFAVVDCTGHGVPGAFMSVMANDLLDRIINQLNDLNSASILNELHNSVVKTLRNEYSDENVLDGMDVGLCVLDVTTNIVEFSGANIPLIRINEDDEVLIYKGDNLSIGGSELDGGMKFTSQSIQLNLGDQLYLSSDGFKDQFGGLKGKKLLKKRFVEALKDGTHETMEVQKKCLLQYFENWKGNLDQLDDICVIGIKITEEINFSPKNNIELIQGISEPLLLS